MDKIKYNCVFGGGGIRGLCYIGAVKALQEYNIEVASIAGSSVGAVFAALYAVGYSYEEIKEMFLGFNLKMFMDLNINIFDNDISLSKGEIFLDWLREKIENKVSVKNGSRVRFKDLDKDLQIHALDINTNTPYIFSKANTPEEEVALAVRMSAGLPGLMKPINYGDAMLVDGDLIKSWPAWKIYNNFNNSDRRILEFRLEGSRDGNEIKNPVDYLNSIISTIWYLSTENIYNTYSQNDRYDFIIFDTKDVILFDFTIDKESRQKLIDKGYSDTVKYFNETLKAKKQNILNVYERIHNNMVILKQAIERKLPDDAVFLVNEILSTMTEDTQYIDASIYDKIKDLKLIIIKNIKNDFIFRKKLQEQKTIKDRCEYVIMLIDERITDIKTFLKAYCNNC